MVPAAQQQQQAQNFRQTAQALGFDLSAYPDDQSAINEVFAALSRANEGAFYTDLGRQVAPQAAAIQRALQQGQQPPAAPQRQPWEPPAFDERWLGMVDQDANGVYRAKLGVPPQIAQQVQVYSDWLRGFQRNPMQLLEPAIKHYAKLYAGEVATQAHQGFEQESASRQILTINSSWMYQRDAQGEALRDRTGRPVPTPEALAYKANVVRLERMGVKDVYELDQMAKEMTYGQLSAQQSRTAPPPPIPGRGPVRRPNVNPGQAIPPSRRAVNPHATQPQRTGPYDLRDAMRDELIAEGVTEEEMFADLMGAGQS